MIRYRDLRPVRSVADAHDFEKSAGHMLTQAILAPRLRDKLGCAWGALSYARRASRWWR